MPIYTRTPSGITPAEAVEIVNGLHYKPGWTITAAPFTERFEGAIRVRINCPALDSSYPPDYPNEITGGLRNDFAIVCQDCPTPEHVIRKVLGEILRFEEHEAREFLRLGPEHNYVAPFHPHTVRGMQAWAALGRRHTGLSPIEQMITRDLAFGRI